MFKDRGNTRWFSLVENPHNILADEALRRLCVEENYQVQDVEFIYPIKLYRDRLLYILFSVGYNWADKNGAMWHHFKELL